MKIHTFLLGVLVLALPTFAWAADGDNCDSDVGRVSRGVWTTSVCVNVCDAAVAADSTCAEFDLGNAGMPDILIFEREENDANCSDAGGPVITITTGPTTGGSPSYDLTSTAVLLNDTINRITIDTQTAPLSRYLFFTTSDDTACTDYDVRMYLVNRTNW